MNTVKLTMKDWMRHMEIKTDKKFQDTLDAKFWQ
jgi:hypothetical protein